MFAWSEVAVFCNCDSRCAMNLYIVFYVAVKCEQPVHRISVFHKLQILLKYVKQQPVNAN